MRVKETAGGRVFDIVNAVVMALLMLLLVYPIYYMFVISLSSANHVMTDSVYLFPRGFTFKAYQTVLGDKFFLRSYVNTFEIMALGTTINLVMSALCAYPLSRRDLVFGRFFTGLIAFTMFFSGGMVPSYLLVNQLGLMNTYWAIILPGCVNVYNMIVMRTFFQGLPFELTESAYIDGATDWAVFRRIILPLSKPILATMLLFYAVSHWNGFVSAVLYLNEKNKYPIQLYVRNVVLSGLTDSLNMGMNVAQEERLLVSQKSMQYAVIISAMIPILLVYPFISKYFEKGVMIGSLKG